MTPPIQSDKPDATLREQLDAIVFRCFAQGQYWGTETDGKLDDDYKPEEPIDRTEAVNLLEKSCQEIAREAVQGALAHTPKHTAQYKQVASLNLAQMVRDIDDIVSGDWGFSVTDDMVRLPSGKLKKFTQQQAEEMSQAIGRVYMIAHAIHCSSCGTKYRLAHQNTRRTVSDTEPSEIASVELTQKPAEGAK